MTRKLLKFTMIDDRVNGIIFFFISFKLNFFLIQLKIKQYITFQ